MLKLGRRRKRMAMIDSAMWRPCFVEKGKRKTVRGYVIEVVMALVGNFSLKPILMVIDFQYTSKSARAVHDLYYRPLLSINILTIHIAHRKKSIFSYNFMDI